MNQKSKDDKFERPHTIYSINDPETGDPLYIGQTVNFQRRKKEHLKLRPGKASTEFLEPMLAAGVEPEFSIIAVVENRKSADAREVEEIRKAQAAGYELFNHISEKNRAAKSMK
ncbi:GIY-YIG nuclease family protein [Ruegeria arenilitoris]|uniref:GIY-YIG nuclease family protein n=1 Tax=Ruegeria arenilitoris TaxID=1173585 RepID=UPI00147FA20D|nr:GIY-YIG nuclease family protein [Ruegeria arenilitoris]